jgi:hypothetical protein
MSKDETKKKLNHKKKCNEKKDGENQNKINKLESIKKI